MIDFHVQLYFIARCDGCGLVFTSGQSAKTLPVLVEWIGREGWIVRCLEAYCPRCVAEKKHLYNGAVEDG